MSNDSTAFALFENQKMIVIGDSKGEFIFIWNRSSFVECHNIILSIDLVEGAAQISDMKDIIQEYPHLKIAIGPFGMPTYKDWDKQIKLARNPNVIIEAGGITWLDNNDFYPLNGQINALRRYSDLSGLEQLP